MKQALEALAWESKRKTLFTVQIFYVFVFGLTLGTGNSFAVNFSLQCKSNLIGQRQPNEKPKSNFFCAYFDEVTMRAHNLWKKLTQQNNENKHFHHSSLKKKDGYLLLEGLICHVVDVLAKFLIVFFRMFLELVIS